MIKILDAKSRHFFSNFKKKCSIIFENNEFLEKLKNIDIYLNKKNQPFIIWNFLNKNSQSLKVSENFNKKYFFYNIRIEKVFKAADNIIFYNDMFLENDCKTHLIDSYDYFNKKLVDNLWKGMFTVVDQYIGYCIQNNVFYNKKSVLYIIQQHLLDILNIYKEDKRGNYKLLFESIEKYFNLIDGIDFYNEAKPFLKEDVKNGVLFLLEVAIEIYYQFIFIIKIINNLNDNNNFSSEISKISDKILLF
ncbi:hypothetical protein SHELI_v1c06450 [Spiroplasma helicoides]|uniref:Uncharacterized protein n=1 Tax=Spiroplasma helicoides TaxID=216938 RepID=A0A1B3SKZ6_9MOLU|nr:hypothetical protein [Spiroplasma helicoides]AOG60596.1 hypothetical protein SHELI_v1c06450 [Spiroplasma helicoides]